MANSGYYCWDQRTIVEVGTGCRNLAPLRMFGMGSKRVALITDPGVVKAGIADLVKGPFDFQGSAPIVGIYDKIAMNCPGDDVNKCARWCREMAIDGIVAVGGGSVMDAAKAVRAILDMNVLDIWDLMPNLVYFVIGLEAKPFKTPLINFPTTAGTGAESTPFSVVLNEEYHIKVAFGHSELPPKYAFLDPDLTVGLPPLMTAYTAFDALCHAVEEYCSPVANDMLDAISRQAIQLILNYLPMAVQDGKNIEARKKLLVASNLACTAQSMLGASPCPVHNLAHPVGAIAGISHGEANAVFLPLAIEKIPEFYLPTASKCAEAFSVWKDGMSKEEALGAVVARLRKLQKDCGVNPRFAARISADMIDKLVMAIKSDPTGMVYYVPEPSAKEILNNAFSK